MDQFTNSIVSNQSSNHKELLQQHRGHLGYNNFNKLSINEVLLQYLLVA